MQKRDYGSGGIRQKPSGSWEASLRVSGRRVTKNFPTRKGAQSWLAKATHEAAVGTLAVSPRMTLAQYLNEWLTAVATTLRPATHELYSYIVRCHIVPALGHVPLSQIQPLAIQHLYQEREASGLAAGTVRRIHAVLHRALVQAVRWRLLATNPTVGLEVPTERSASTEVWTAAQVRTFLAHIRAHRLCALYLLAVATGMRRGELLALSWEDVDFDRATLRIRQTAGVVRRQLVLSEPKTAKGRRAIAVPEVAIHALSEHRQRMAAEGWPTASGWVFVSVSGTVIWPTHLVRQFHTLSKEAGLPRIRFHALRHTAATLMLSRGVHPKVVQEMLGHSAVTMTLDTYSHVLPTMQQQAAAAMQALLA